MATAQQIAQALGLENTQPAATDLTAVSSIEAAAPTTVVFAATADALAEALASSAGLILTRPSLAQATARILPVSDPRLAFATVAAHLAPILKPHIHATATVHPTAVLAVTVTVGPHCVVGAAVHIDDHTVLHANVVLEPGITLGARCTVQSGAVLGSYGFGYARRLDGTYLLFPQQGTLVVEDDVEIGANTTIDRGALGETRIGTGTKIDNLVHIGHNCRIGRNCILAAQTGISGSTVVEDGAILGGQVGIGEHAHVGPGVILGGGAGVLSNKKLHGPGQVFWGRPAQPLKQYLRDLARLRKGGN